MRISDWSSDVCSSDLALTVDFGGGTLDLSVVRYSNTGAAFGMLATAGVALGGDRIDQLIFEAMLFPLLGKGETWARMVDEIGRASGRESVGQYRVELGWRSNIKKKRSTKNTTL